MWVLGITSESFAIAFNGGAISPALGSTVINEECEKCLQCQALIFGVVLVGTMSYRLQMLCP